MVKPKMWSKASLPADVLAGPADDGAQLYLLDLASHDGVVRDRLVVGDQRGGGLDEELGGLDVEIDLFAGVGGVVVGGEHEELAGSAYGRQHLEGVEVVVGPGRVVEPLDLGLLEQQQEAEVLAGGRDFGDGRAGDDANSGRVGPGR